MAESGDVTPDGRLDEDSQEMTTACTRQFRLRETTVERAMTDRAHPLHDQSVGEIAARLAGASNVFRRFGIDFCCQGHVSLKDAANHRNFNLDELEAALEALDPSAPQRVPQETGALINHIKTCYHDVHRQQLPELIALSRKVEAVHDEPSECAGR